MPDPKDGFKKVNGIPVETIVQDYLTANPPGGGAWGSITGTLSAQTDLQTALNALIPKPNSPTTGYYLKWDGTNWVAAAVAAGGGETVVRVNKPFHELGDYSPVETTSTTFQDTGISWNLVSGKTYAVDMFIEVSKNTSDVAQLMISSAYNASPYTEMKGVSVFGGQDASGNSYGNIDPSGNGDFIQISTGMPSSASARVFLQFKGVLIAANTVHKLFIKRSSGTTTDVSVTQMFASFTQLD